VDALPYKSRVVLFQGVTTYFIKVEKKKRKKRKKTIALNLELNFSFSLIEKWYNFISLNIKFVTYMEIILDTCNLRKRCNFELQLHFKNIKFTLGNILDYNH
jgi:hypothetical protein